MKSKQPRVWERALLSAALISILFFGSVGQASAASIIYVKYNATGSNNGTSWANAYRSLQKALSVAVAGQQIWVAKGVYRPTGTTDRTKTFTLKNGVAIYGGFAGTETLLARRRPGVNITTLSGDIGVAGVVGDNSYSVVTGGGTNSTAILDGFTIASGNGNCACTPGDGGAGIFNWNSSPTLRNLTISSNLTAGYGAGMYNGGSSPTLVNVTFRGNQAGPFADGGGMYNEYGSNPKLIGVTFSGNTANNGGGIYNSSSNPTLTNVTFSGNTAVGYGGGIYNTSSSPTLRNNTFSGNTASTWGSGMYDDNSSSPLVQNTIFWGDTSTEIINTISQSTITDSILAGGCPVSPKYICTNVINVDPVLGALQNNGGFTQTMSLGVESAAIDAGGVNAVCAAKDQRGVSRPQGGRCDIGAYEVRVASFASVGTYDGQATESSQNSGVGGSFNSTNATFRVGDTKSNQQMRGFLSFNTSGLPDGATIVIGRVTVKQQTIGGYSPFITHGNLLIDLKKPYFGSGITLAASDFQAADSVDMAGTFDPTLVGGGYLGQLGDPSLAYINKIGPTQLRLRFTWNTDNDFQADYVSFYSGDTTTVSSRPRLIVYYNP